MASRYIDQLSRDELVEEVREGRKRRVTMTTSGSFLVKLFD